MNIENGASDFSLLGSFLTRSVIIRVHPRPTRSLSLGRWQGNLCLSVASSARSGNAPYMVFLNCRARSPIGPPDALLGSWAFPAFWLRRSRVVFMGVQRLINPVPPRRLSCTPCRSGRCRGRSGRRRGSWSRPSPSPGPAAPWRDRPGCRRRN